MHLTLTEPRFDADRLHTFLSQRKAALNTRNASPGTRFSDHKRKVVYQNHPRRLPWDAAMYDAVDIGTAEAFYKARFASRGDMTAVFVGNIDLKRLRTLVEQYLAPLANEAAPSTWQDVGAPRRTGVHIETFAAGKEDRARIELTFHGPFSKNRANDFIRGQFVQALRKKLRLSLREENSGTYGVGVSSGSYWVPNEEYRLSISFTCASARAKELTDLMWIELKAIKDEALSPAFVADLQNAARKDREKQIRTNGFWASGLDWRLRYEEPLEDILEHDQYIEALTAQQIQSMAQELVNETQYTQFTWVPEKE